MADRQVKLGICLVLALFVAAPGQAQEPSWGLRVFAQGGGNIPLRNLGKNAVEIQEQSALQVVAQLENSPSIGGGLELLFPNQEMRIRGQFAMTTGATATGILGLCESGELAAPGQGLCALNIETDAQVMDGTAELVFLAGRPGRLVRPTISFGIGVRSFDFDSDALNCSDYGGELDDAFQICQQSREILENPSVNPSLTFGVGLEADRDPVSAFLRLAAVTCSYTGGAGMADGGRQVDLALTGGLAFRVR